ncbi:MAG: hypothetical protein ACJAX4_002439 [Clostridium sp.]|jgi:hypothetical protein
MIKFGNKYKISLFICLLVLSLNIVGCADKKIEKLPKTQITETVKSIVPTIIFPKLTIKKDTDITWSIIGEAINKDTVKHTYTATITFYDSENNILTTGDASLIDIGSGETKTFTDDTDVDISKATYKIQINTIGE